MKLSENFRSAEFACPCCGAAKVDPQLIAGLEQLRGIVNKPIRITSGYRCKAHNAKVGGAKNSQHFLGTAADIAVEGISVLELALAAEMVPAFAQGGIGTYQRDGHLHIDIRAKRARWRA